jgi:tight adherence protein C
MSTLIGLLVSLAVSLLIGGIRRIRTPGYEMQLAPFGEMQNNQPRSRYERTVRPIMLSLANNVTVLRGLVNTAKVSRQLDYAGNPGNITANELYGIQLCCGMLGLFFGVWLVILKIPLSQILAIVMPVFGFMYPSFWLRGKVRRRQHAISVALPDLLDMMAVCVTAGMGFDIALSLLTERGEGPLYEEISRLLRELRIGEPREQAFRHVSERNSSEELRVFIDAILQAEELGTPIALVLERQADDIRIKRRHNARAQGAKAATKISLVVVLLVMPSVLCLILAALGMTIGRNIGPMFDGTLMP